MTVYERHSALPRTLLLGTEDDGYRIVLVCDCGTHVPYPGHPPDRTEVQCEGCNAIWLVPPQN